MKTGLEMCWRIEAAKVAAAGMNASVEAAATKIHARHPAAEAASRLGDMRGNQGGDEKCA
ncbi:hypothetical protein GR212_22495 [Rhizobium lusitanum]|uniref:Uncharacterized protein n=1 Tax=Rhizobium lusitanum TaxID=293958 RepID=A0A6L9UE34_9HYPH|nr:hypothetical protein [Rhizobium lusitanum]NEI72360.1 hypothetical protein [Rhizobium lusitanum]